MALIELNSDWTKREFGVFDLARDAWRALTDAERREAEALHREKLEERRKADAA
ncbi:hypothetical protein [Martelella endophytica]|uniref:hypothetical protein n=1 Tax=Martelella endophytica TaxID=1486262 RepID=UPI000A4105E8|nr:hypothetical protein [Martelella endophytica]